MKRFNINIISSEVLQASKIAEKLLLPDSAMMLDLRNKNDWKYDSGSGEDVCNKLLSCTKAAQVFTYRPWFARSRAIAHAKDSSIFFNIYKVNLLSISDIVGTLLHEYSHLAGFNHGNNWKTQDKVLYSVPYYVSENVEKWV